MGNRFPESALLRVSKARNGDGIFTKRAIPQGSRLFEVTGRVITGDLDEVLTKRERDDAFRVSSSGYITPSGSMGQYLNHSCAPNAAVVKIGTHLYVYAVDAIPRGSEVLIDYSTITGSDDLFTMPCNCGSTKCRTVVRQFKRLPASIRNDYISRGMVPSYILL